MSKHKVLVAFLGVAVLAGVLLIRDAQVEAKEAYAAAEIGIGTAVEKIMDANMPQGTKDKLLTDMFSEMPRMSDHAKITLSRSNAAERTDMGKNSTARKNVCRGLFRALDNTKSTTAKSRIQQHISDRNCTR